MQADYIRRDTPEEISEDGGAHIQIVNKSTVGLTASIKEAISQLYCVGEPSMIEGYFAGIMRSIFEGIQADGHPRTVGDITFYPACGGTFDLTKGWDPLVNDVRIKARLASGLELDVSDWTFRDVTEGRVSFSIDNISDGTTVGVVSSNKNACVNGKSFPPHDLLTISWVCGEKSGTVDAAKFTASVSRIDIDKTAFATLGAADTDKDITITVKGCYNKATKTAKYVYVAPPPAPTVTITKLYSVGDEEPEEQSALDPSRNIYVKGTNLTKVAGDTVTLVDTDGQSVQHTYTLNILESDATHQVLEMPSEIASLSMPTNGNFTFTLHGGVAGSTPQVIAKNGISIAF